MAVYSVNTTNQEEIALNGKLIIVNNERAAQGLPAITKPQLVQLGFEEKLQDYRAQVLADRNLPVIVALATATMAQINQIKNILGI